MGRDLEPGNRPHGLVCEYYDGFSFGKFVDYPHLTGRVTDLLIGDLFTDKVDEVWEPMETLLGKEIGSQTLRSSGFPVEVASTKQNELFLPDGPGRNS